MKKTIVVNLFGGPGTGKSTMMAAVFSKLKWKGIDCEMATEYAKDKVWENSISVLDDQLYVTAKQYHRVFRLNGKVDVIITDSPILLGVIYNNLYNSIDIPDFNNLVLKLFNKFDNINFFLHREKEFNPNGRLQSEKESKELDITIKKTLDELNIKYIDGIGNDKTIDKIVNIIIEKLK